MFTSMRTAMLGLLVLAALGAEAGASKITVLVVGGRAEQRNAATDPTHQFGEFERNLFAYGSDAISDAVIMGGRNLSKERLEQRIHAFNARIDESAVSLFVYIGPTVHSADGSAYLVPANWDGSESGVVPLKDLMASLRAKGKGLVFIDSLEPPPSAINSAKLRPGLGTSLKAEAAPDRLLIAAIDVRSEAGMAQTPISNVLYRQIGKVDLISLPSLASHVKDEVTFETRNRRYPSVFGSIGGFADMKRLSTNEQVEKAKRCRVARGEPAPTNEFAERPTEMRVASDGPHVASRFDWWWYCPEGDDERAVVSGPKPLKSVVTTPRPASPSGPPPSKAYVPRGPSPNWVPGG